MDYLLLCLPLLLPRVSVHSVYFLSLVQLQQSAFSLLLVYWPLHSPASLPLILYPLWLATADEDSFLTQYSDPVFSCYSLQYVNKALHKILCRSYSGNDNALSTLVSSWNIHDNTHCGWVIKSLSSVIVGHTSVLLCIYYKVR